MASDSDRGLTPRVNFFDGQKVTESDMDSEQIYNRSVISGTVKDFHGSGVVWEERFNDSILLDTSFPDLYSGDNDNLSKTTIESGSYDGKAITLDRGPSDTVRGSRLEVELSESYVSGRNSASVLIIGFAFDGINEDGLLVSEFINFRQNDRRLTRYYYLNIVAVFFNNFSGGLGSTEVESDKNSTDNNGRIVIKEAGPLSVYPQPIVASQFGMPNVFLRDFITSDPNNSIEDEIKEIFGTTVNFNELYFELESESQLEFEKDGDNSVAYGQKFLFKSNNLQKISILLSVERDDENEDGHEFDFSGDIVLSIYELATETNCPTDVVPDNLMDFDPDSSPIMEISYNQDDLLELGYEIDDTPLIVEFNFAGTLIADPLIEPSMEENRYYAFMVSRRGDNRVGTVLMEKGYDPATRKYDNGQTLSKLEEFGKQSTRFVEFDPRTKRYVDDHKKSLWFAIHSDTVEVTSGIAYSEDGFLISLPKTEEYIGNSEVSRFERNIPLVDVSEGAKNYILLSNSSKYMTPDVHPRTGNFVYTRILDSATISVSSEDGLEELLKDSTPIILSVASDENTRDFQDITGEFNMPGLYIRDKIFIVDPDNDLLNSNLINMIITPDLDCECTSRYRISSVKCYDVLAGDLDGDGELTSEDILSMLDYVGSTINSETTERKILGGELEIINFLKADLNKDETIDGFDIQLLEDAIDGYVNFTVEEKIRILEISVENILLSEDYPVIFTDEADSGEALVGASTITFTVSDEAEALALRPDDKILIPADVDDYGTYIIDTKIIGDDGVSVEVTVVGSEGEEVLFIGSSGFSVEVVSGTATNMLADNLKLSNVPFESKNYSISFIEAPFEGRFIVICDLRRYVESTFIEESNYGLCECSDDNCETPEICMPQYKNQYVFPNDIYIPDGEIYSSPGIPYHGDFEYALVSIPMPPGSIDDCQINLYETFIKSEDGECSTAAGYPAMKYSDGTYVGCEDSGSDTDISKNRVKISHAIASLHVDSLIDGYAIEDGYEESIETFDSDLQELILETLVDSSYDSFEDWSENILSDTTITTITKPTGPNEPAIFMLFTTADSSPRFGRLDMSEEPDVDVSDDFVIDFTVFRSSWAESTLVAGYARYYMVLNIENADSSTAELKFGWRQHGTVGLKMFYSGEIYDSSSILISNFDFEIDAADALGDEVMFRLRRINDVCTAMYFIPSRIDYTENPTGQYIKIGENPDVHPGSGDGRLSFLIEQESNPTPSLSFSANLVSVTVESEYEPSDSEDEYITISRDSDGNVERATMSFPLSLPKKTSVVSAYLNLKSYGPTSSPDLFNLTPIDAIDSDNLGHFYNYPLSLNESLIESFRPGSVGESEVISIDITSMVISFLAEAGHLPGYVKAFLLEPDQTADSSFSFYSDEIEVVVEYLDITTGVIFKVGISVDPTTGIASFKTKNVLYDAMIEENRTVIEFGVFLKKSRFINDNIYVGIADLTRIGIGTCVDDDALLEDDECFFIAGSTSTGTFVQGPFPCAFHLPQF